MEGIIIKGVGGLYSIKVDDKIINCKVRGKFRYNGMTPIVGDKVTVSLIGDSNEGVIEKIHGRSTKLIRPLVSNVSQAFVVFAIKKPDINQDLLFKFLILTEYNNLKSVVCFNKMDLAHEEDIKIIEMLKNAGYEVIRVKALEEKGLEELKERIKDNISVFCGPSGVGKSTILNKLIGREYMETGEISKKLKRGKHTTRHSELIECDGGFLVDTPGFSSLDISFIEKEELKNYFPEFHHYEDECRFSNCMHYKEPNCSIKNAVESGEINRERYDFYIKTLEEIMNGRNKRW